MRHIQTTSDGEAIIRRIDKIESIPNADKIETAYVGLWPCVVPKGQYKETDMICYVPVDSIVPESVLEKYGLSGKLSGTNKNRVKAIKLRKQLSVGLIFDVPDGLKEGDNASEFYGIKKYEEVIPIQMRGIAKPLPPNFSVYDVDNLNNLPNMFSPEDMVVISEKTHGSNGCFGLIPAELNWWRKIINKIVGRNLWPDKFVVLSRRINLEPDTTNIYWKIAKKYKIHDKLKAMKQWLIEDEGIMASNNTLYLFGEIYGKGIQDLHYGKEETSFVAFDIKINRTYLHYNEFSNICTIFPVPMVPLLYIGQFNLEKAQQLSQAKEKISGNELHMNEGVVIRTYREAYDHKGRRKQLKLINPKYLLRKEGTELE